MSNQPSWSALNTKNRVEQDSGREETPGCLARVGHSIAPFVNKGYRATWFARRCRAGHLLMGFPKKESSVLNAGDEHSQDYSTKDLHEHTYLIYSHVVFFSQHKCFFDALTMMRHGLVFWVGRVACCETAPFRKNVALSWAKHH